MRSPSAIDLSKGQYIVLCFEESDKRSKQGMLHTCDVVSSLYT